MRTPALVLIVSLIVPMHQPTFAAGWWSLEDRRMFPGSGGSTVRVSVVTIDLRQANLRGVSVPFAARSSVGSTELSVRGLAQALLKQPRYRGKEWILVNGGFSSYRVDVPLGLLVVDGKVYSTLSKEKTRRTQEVSGSDYSQLRWSGVLCQRTATSNWEIVPAARYTPGSCRHALQAGPVPIEPISRMAIGSSEPKLEKPYVRTVICIASESRIKVATTRDATHLLPMAIWMSRPEASGGLGCRAALNLSGDSSSGVVINGAKSPTLIGEGSFPLPTALVFEAK